MYLVKKKALKDFLSLWCIPKISNEDIIAAVCLRNELIETVPDETRVNMKETTLIYWSH